MICFGTFTVSFVVHFIMVIGILILLRLATQRVAADVAPVKDVFFFLLFLFFGLPIVLIYGLIALVYLVFVCCFKLFSRCRSNQVSPRQ